MQKSLHISFIGLSLCLPMVIWACKHLYLLFPSLNEFQSTVLLLACTGIALSAFNLAKNKGIKSVPVKVASLIGILLNAGLLGFVWATTPPEMTGFVSSISSTCFMGYERCFYLDLDQPTDQFIERTLDPQKPLCLVNINGDTIIYEQTGTSRKRLMDRNRLQENQYVRVKWDHYMWDPTQVDAINITILDR